MDSHSHDLFGFYFAWFICLVSCVCFGCCLSGMTLCLSLSVLLLDLAVCLCLSSFPCLYKIAVSFKKKIRYIIVIHLQTFVLVICLRFKDIVC